jgi:hypothetical protein
MIRNAVSPGTNPKIQIQILAPTNAHIFTTWPFRMRESTGVVLKAGLQPSYYCFITSPTNYAFRLGKPTRPFQTQMPLVERARTYIHLFIFSMQCAYNLKWSWVVYFGIKYSVRMSSRLIGSVALAFRKRGAHEQYAYAMPMYAHGVAISQGSNITYPYAHIWIM